MPNKYNTVFIVVQEKDRHKADGVRLSMATIESCSKKIQVCSLIIVK
jgi:hypothetical protein